MHFRQSGQRTERRRRVLMEEAAQGDVASAPPPEETPAHAARGGAVATYDAAALDACRYRLTDLIPTRPWTLLVLSLLLMTLIAGVLTLHGGVLLHPRFRLPREAAAALDVTAPGSLASWLAATLLLTASLGALLVYVLRRHRMDDYRGHYRIWTWASLGLLVGSIDAGTRTHELLAAALTRLAGTPLLGDGAAWWIGFESLVLGGLAARMLVEVRRSRFAVLTLLAAAGAYAAAACLRLGVLPLDEGVLLAMAEAACSLLGHACLLVTVLAYARHVLLDAQGKLPSRAARKQRTSRRRDKSRGRGKEERDGEDSAGETASRKRAAKRQARQKSVEPAGRDETMEEETGDEQTAAKAPATRRKRQTRVDTPHAGEAKAGRDEASSHPRPAAEEASAGEESGDEDEMSGLSKAERRRMRKLRRRQNKAQAG